MFAALYHVHRITRQAFAMRSVYVAHLLSEGEMRLSLERADRSMSNYFKFRFDEFKNVDSQYLMNLLVPGASATSYRVKLLLVIVVSTPAHRDGGTSPTLMILRRGTTTCGS